MLSTGYILATPWGSARDFEQDTDQVRINQFAMNRPHCALYFLLNGTISFVFNGPLILTVYGLLLLVYLSSLLHLHIFWCRL